MNRQADFNLTNIKLSFSIRFVKCYKYASEAWAFKAITMHKIEADVVPKTSHRLYLTKLVPQIERAIAESKYRLIYVRMRVFTAYETQPCNVVVFRT